MIKRVGIVAKPRLHAISKDLPAIASWLLERGVEPVFDETRPTGRAGGLRRVTRDELPGQVDLILLLGGDGTLLGMADRVAQAGLEVPILGVNFGGLWFLTEVTYDELTALGAPDGPGQSRLMLRAVINGEVNREPSTRPQRRHRDRGSCRASWSSPSVLAGSSQVPRRRHHLDAHRSTACIDRGPIVHRRARWY
jgi:NAD kinase